MGIFRETKHKTLLKLSAAVFAMSIVIVSNLSPLSASAASVTPKLPIVWTNIAHLSAIDGTGNGGNTGGTGGTGTSTPPSSSFTGTISPTNTTVPAGERLDFNGRNFSHETDVKITLNGKMVGSVHADGGGNFSTGSIMAPTADGVYTYIFSEVGTSNTLNSVITVGNGSSATTTSQ